MNKHQTKAFLMMTAARPASGFRPETEEEWQKLLRAHEEMGYATYRTAGLSDKDARALARQTHGGPGGRLMLMMAFSEDQDE